MPISDPRKLVCPVSTSSLHRLRVRTRNANTVWVDKTGAKHHIVYCTLCFEHFDSILRSVLDRKGKAAIEREFVPLTKEEVTRILQKPKDTSVNGVTAESLLNKSSQSL